MSYTLEDIKKILQQKILVLDGAMGIVIQNLGLSEDDFRGEQFKDQQYETERETKATKKKPHCFILAAIFAKAINSSVLAKKAGVYMREELTPTAPSSIASATNRHILSNPSSSSRLVLISYFMNSECCRANK